MAPLRQEAAAAILARVASLHTWDQRHNALQARQLPPPYPGPGVIPPPPGVTPDFDHPTSRQGMLRAAVISCLVITMFFTSIRIWTRLTIFHAVGWDDYFCAIAMAIGVAFDVCVFRLLRYGQGLHLWEIRQQDWNVQQNFMWGNIGYVFYMAGMGLVKVSILFLYSRLFTMGRTIKWAISAVMASVVVYVVALELALIFGCRPPRAAFVLQPNARCIEFRPQLLAYAVLNLISDVAIIVLPVRTVLALQLPKRQRYGVLGTFLVGIVVCAVSIARLVKVSFRSVGDVTWESGQIYIWSIVEIHLAIICSCMPALNSLFVRFVPWVRQQTAKGSSQSSGSKSARLSSVAKRTRDSLPPRVGGGGGGGSGGVGGGHRDLSRRGGEGDEEYLELCETGENGEGRSTVGTLGSKASGDEIGLAYSEVGAPGRAMGRRDGATTTAASTAAEAGAGAGAGAGGQWHGHGILKTVGVEVR